MANDARGKNQSDCVCYPKDTAVMLNDAGRAANMGIKDRTVWKIGEVILVPDHPIHPERYHLDPPHPFGSISGMFLQHADGPL